MATLTIPAKEALEEALAAIQRIKDYRAAEISTVVDEYRKGWYLWPFIPRIYTTDEARKRARSEADFCNFVGWRVEGGM